VRENINSPEMEDRKTNSPSLRATL